jgi:uncharacterized protein
MNAPTISDPGTSADQKLERMKEILRSLRRVIVAFSAGVDSTFLLKVAIDTLGPANVLAATADSDSLSRAEFEESRRLADRFGAPHRVIATQEMNDPNYRANPANRCYFCKTELYTKLQPILAAEGYAAIVNGINADDLGDWRPGIQAAKDNAVRSPCAEAGMTKQDIRVLSERMGLPTYDKPASPCLSSRIQYGEEITPAKLKMVEQGEAFLHSLGIRECRVRHHNNMARIEIPADQIVTFMQPEMRAKIDAEFHRIGYNYVAMDLRGFRSGSMNEVIAFGKKQPAL